MQANLDFIKENGKVNKDLRSYGIIKELFNVVDPDIDMKFEDGILFI